MSHDRQLGLFVGKETAQELGHMTVDIQSEKGCQKERGSETE
jgi:predicted NBD/HSP70 family sugar kinase